MATGIVSLNEFSMFEIIDQMCFRIHKPIEIEESSNLSTAPQVVVKIMYRVHSELL
jgi:hypothetical protein